MTISSTEPPVAGHFYSLTCKASLVEGLTNPPDITWTGPSGTQVVDEGDITVITSEKVSVIEFNPLHLLYNGSYSCSALVVVSPALSFALNSSAHHDISILISKCIYINNYDYCYGIDLFL